MSQTTTYDTLGAGFFDGQLGGASEGDKFRSKYDTFVAAVQSDFGTVQGRSGHPELDWLDGGAPAASGGDMVLRGRNLLQGKTFDTITVTQGAASFTVTALKPGVSGLSVIIGTPAGGGAAVSVSGSVITITPAAAGSTDDAMATAVNANGADTDGLVRATSAGGGSFNAAQGERVLAGGTGDYTGTKVLISGTEALPANQTGATTTAKWSDTAITVTVPDLTALSPARAAADLANIVVESDGVYSQALTAVLA